MNLEPTPSGALGYADTDPWSVRTMTGMRNRRRFRKTAWNVKPQTQPRGQSK